MHALGSDDNFILDFALGVDGVKIIVRERAKRCVRLLTKKTKTSSHDAAAFRVKVLVALVLFKS